jgi:hypothetical protein
MSTDALAPLVLTDPGRAAYSQAPVAEYLSGLAEARLVDRRSDGRKVLYRPARGLRDAVSPPPVYVDWVTVWPALVALLGALRPEGLSQDAQWVRLAEALAAQRDALAGEGFGVEIDDLRGRAATGPLAEAVESVVGRIRQLAE